MTVATYVTWLTSLLPGPLAGPWGRRWAGVVGAVGGDELLADAKVAVKARLPSEAPEDALPLLGADRVMPRLPGETVAAWRARIADAWETWRWAGTRHGLEVVIGQLGFTSYRLKTAADFAPGLPPGHRGDLWARWWLFIYVHPWTRTTWGSGTWGSGTWGSSASAADVARVTGALRQVTNARDRGTVRLYFGGTALGGWGLGTWGGGTWGEAGTSYIDWIVE